MKIMIALVLAVITVLFTFAPALAATDPQEFVRSCSGEWSHEKYGKGGLRISVAKVQDGKASGTVEGVMADGRSNSRPSPFTDGKFEDREGVKYLIFNALNPAQVNVTYEITLNNGGFSGRSIGRITSTVTLNKCS